MVREGGKSRLTVCPQAVQIESDAVSQAQVALSLGIAPEINFAADSPLVDAVTSEPVSESSRDL